MPSLKQTIDQANNLHLEVTPLMSFYQQDVQMLNNIATLRAARQLHSDVNTQYQQALAVVTVSIPYFLATKLDTLQKQIQLLHAQAQDTTKYEQDIKRYKVMTSRYMSIADFQDLANHLDDDINQIKDGPATHRRTQSCCNWIVKPKHGAMHICITIAIMVRVIPSMLAI